MSRAESPLGGVQHGPEDVFHAGAPCGVEFFGGWLALAGGGFLGHADGGGFGVEMVGPAHILFTRACGLGTWGMELGMTGVEAGAEVLGVEFAFLGGGFAGEELQE